MYKEEARGLLVPTYSFVIPFRRVARSKGGRRECQPVSERAPTPLSVVDTWLCPLTLLDL
jgi:hypothetical protein